MGQPSAKARAVFGNCHVAELIASFFFSSCDGCGDLFFFLLFFALGLAIEGAVLPALLTGIVGLGWSKDNLRTADRCYVNGTYPNGTVKWPCGSINSGEGTQRHLARGLL